MRRASSRLTAFVEPAVAFGPAIVDLPHDVIARGAHGLSEIQALFLGDQVLPSIIKLEKYMVAVHAFALTDPDLRVHLVESVESASDLV